MDLPDFDEPFDPGFDPLDPDLFDKKVWEVPAPIRKIVEQHVAAQLPAEIPAKLRNRHARGLPISSDPAFFHFGGGMSVRNLCRQRLGDRANWQPAARSGVRRAGADAPLFAITHIGLEGLPFAQEWSIRALFPNMALSDLARRTLDVRSWGAERTRIRAAMTSESGP
jgi:hypothetical protein